MHDLPRSLVALLVAEACNVGFVPVIKDGDEALTRGRLSHVDQNYVRTDTHAAANAVLIEHQRSIPIVAQWGGGLLASVDGLRFVVPGTPRDSLFILDCLINIDAGPKPEVVTTDQASDSDMVFGIFSMLGYRFAPRFADLGDQRFWRADVPTSGTPDAPSGGSDGDATEADASSGYGPLDAIARNKINRTKIRRGRPDPPALPRRPGRPARRARPGRQCRRVVEFPLPEVRGGRMKSVHLTVGTDPNRDGRPGTPDQELGECWVVIYTLWVSYRL